MNEPSMNWKLFSVSMVQALRWPLAVVAVALIFQAPGARLIDAIATALLR